MSFLFSLLVTLVSVCLSHAPLASGRQIYAIVFQYQHGSRNCSRISTAVLCACFGVHKQDFVDKEIRLALGNVIRVLSIGKSGFRS